MARTYEKIDDTNFKEITEEIKTLTPLVNKLRFQRQLLAMQQVVVDDLQAQVDAIKAIGIDEPPIAPVIVP